MLYCTVYQTSSTDSSCVTGESSMDWELCSTDSSSLMLLYGSREDYAALSVVMGWIHMIDM